jgi:AI-2 transport protein TqsA
MRMPDAPPSLKKPRTVQMVVLLAALVIIIAGLKAAQTFFVPVLLAFFLATVSYPVTDWLRRRGVPPTLAVLLTVLIDFSFLVGVVLLGVSIVGTLQQKWDAEYYELTKAKIQDASSSLALKLGEWGVQDAGQKLREVTAENLAELHAIKVAQVWNLSTDVVGRVVSFFATFGVVIILTIFMLSEAWGFRRRFGAIRAARGPNFERMAGAMIDTQRYLTIKTIMSLVTGLFAGLMCWWMGLDFFLLWGILAFVTNFIPVVGSIIASVPPILLAVIMKGGGAGAALQVAIGYAVIYALLDNLVQPLLLGRRFGLSILVVVLSVLFWGWLWGIIGVLLAVPLTMILKVILDNTEEFRWIAVAIGQEVKKPSATEVKFMPEGAPAEPDLPPPSKEQTAAP